MAPEENLLDNLVLAYPCPIKWEAMEGDERARICNQCSQHVYNISDMTTSEAEKFLSETIETDDACLLFYVREDGTIKTDNCPRILRPIRNFATCVHRATVLALSVVATAALSACNNTWAQSVLDKGIFVIKEDLQMDVDGRPAPSQTRDLIKEVQLEASFYASKDLSNQLNEEVKQRGINLSTLEKLSDYYAKNELPSQQLIVDLLQELVKRKTPGAHAPFDSEKFERLRQVALDKMLDDAEKLLAEKKWTQAIMSISNFEHIAGLNIDGNNTSAVLPKDVRAWTICSKSSIYMSPQTLDRAIKVYKKLDEFICSANMTLLDLETAKQLSSAKFEDQDAIIKASQKKYVILRQINLSLAYPYVVAELENLVPEKKFLSNSYIATYRVIEDPSKTIFGEEFQIPLHFNPIFSPKLPSIGSKHFLIIDRNTADKTYSLRGPVSTPIDYEPWIVEKYKFENKKAMTVHKL
ncbi:MAG: hypothetical protein KIT34_05330 [Cyanobacteria bacterium TGS_CYA1]|nr:hypothetical protein [Cyanobacteria bacterium TGS_CYA1]